MKKLHYTLLAAALLAAGCAEEVTNHASSASKFITFNVTNGDATSWNSDFEPGTRGEVVEKATPQQTMEQFKSESPLEEPICLFTTVEDNDSWGVDSVPRYLTRGAEVTSFTTFGWFAYIGSTEVYGNSSVTKGTTDFKTDQYWPADAVSGTKTYDFYAYYPYLSETTNGLTLDQNNKIIIYDATAATAANQQDLMVANVSRDYSNGSNLDLSFVHACTQVIIKTGNNFDTRGGKVKKIIFENIVTSGKCAINTTNPTWSNTASTASWTVYDDATGVGGDNENILSGGTALMMIPQGFTNDNQVIKVVITDKTGTENTLSLTLNGTSWVRAKRVTYTISTSAITSFEVTYPTWDDGSESGIYGPVENYETGESFGLFAVDKAGKIVIANAQIKVTEASGHKGTCKLTGSTTEEAFNESSLANVIPSQNYTYYLYYPYTTTNTQINALSAGTDAPGGGSGTADTFFANVVAGWSPGANQGSLPNLKDQDLQISAVTTSGSATRAFSMAHKMGLAEIELKTATYYAIVEANNGTSTITRTTDTNEEVTASSNFDSTSPYYIPVQKGSTKLYYAVVKTGTNSTEFNSQAGTDQWADAVIATDISAGAIGHYDVYSTRVGTSTYSGSFSYSGSYLTFTVPFSGTYTIECWGASGGYGGKGAYVSGSIDFEESTTLYIYVGEEGAQKGSKMSFNGGGYGRWRDNDLSGCGGGATDVRLKPHSESDGWSGNASLYTRIIVAGGGGGGVHWNYYGNGISIGADAGGTTGNDGVIVVANGHSATSQPSLSRGGGQTAGGAGGMGGAFADGLSGGLGYGGSTNTSYRNASGAGGGGYYGGGSGGEGGYCMGTGAGGSSFISNYSGCTAPSGYRGSSSNILKYNNKEYKFDAGTMIMKSGSTNMTHPITGSSETGHSGNGYCRIIGQSTQ